MTFLRHIFKVKLLGAFIATLSLNITAMNTKQPAAAPVDEGARLSI